MKNLIVIPAYNEEQCLADTVRSLQQLPENYEIVIINDGSKDQTQEVAYRAKAQSRLKLEIVEMSMNGGIGVAVQTGYLFAAKRGDYDYVIQFDADGQHDAGSVEALVRECQTKGLDLCIGSRFLHLDEGNFRSTLRRRIGIRFYSVLIRVLSGLKVTDPTSGSRCAGPRAWKRFAEHYPDDYPEPVSLFWCARNKLRVGELPVRMYQRQGGVSSIRYFKTFDYMLKVPLAILVDRLRMKEMPHVDR